MKSTEKQLENRGYFSSEIEIKFAEKTLDELIELLNSKSAIERTVSARLIAKTKNPKSISSLCLTLEKENKLYTKIEICNSLVSYGKKAIPELVKRLSKIGNNQHKHIAKTELKKNNYPLPRDIIARTIIRIVKDALPLLIENLKINDTQKISESIDTIGYICFYDKKEEVMLNLITCYENYSENELIKWKIIRAMSAFKESEKFLNKEYELIKNDRLKREIKRSIKLVKQRNVGK
ncbi:MAG: hypothetical protein K8R58_05500 [Bacteroidales bacterium]|nr:hypothetical protein [Bacteroidales bacterium]